jgi:hypothetical protein
VRLWRADSPDRDFRLARWSAGPDGRERVLAVDRPAVGYSAVFAEAVYRRGLAAYSLSTNLAVLSAPGVPDTGVRPLGNRGICAANGAR